VGLVLAQVYDVCVRGAAVAKRCLATSRWAA
jgi:hypothetical protein